MSSLTDAGGDTNLPISHRHHSPASVASILVTDHEE